MRESKFHFSLCILVWLSGFLDGWMDSGCDPLTPEDIAEIIVFMAGRRENVVVAETMVYPNHQASAGVMYRRPT